MYLLEKSDNAKTKLIKKGLPESSAILFYGILYHIQELEKNQFVSMFSFVLYSVLKKKYLLRV